MSKIFFRIMHFAVGGFVYASDHSGWANCNHQRHARKEGVMSKIVTGFCGLLLLVVLSPLTTHADPLVITGGTLTVTGPTGGPRFTFFGQNFVLGGVSGEPGASGPQRCRPCSGSINVGSFFGGTLGGGVITINGVTFEGSLGGSYEFSGPSILLPAGTSNITVTGPFTFSGTFVLCGSDPCHGPIIFTTELVGSGHVLIDLSFNPNGVPGTFIYDFQRVTYVFDNPVPEPASIVLLLSGLVGGGAHRKFRFRKRS